MKLERKLKQGPYCPAPIKEVWKPKACGTCTVLAIEGLPRTASIFPPIQQHMAPYHVHSWHSGRAGGNRRSENVLPQKQPVQPFSGQTIKQWQAIQIKVNQQWRKWAAQGYSISDVLCGPRNHCPAPRALFLLCATQPHEMHSPERPQRSAFLFWLCNGNRLSGLNFSPRLRKWAPLTPGMEKRAAQAQPGRSPPGWK